MPRKASIDIRNTFIHIVELSLFCRLCTALGALQVGIG